MNHKKQQSTEALFKSYGRGMYNICLRMIGNKQDAEDILQDAFYQAYLGLDKLRSMESFGAWLKKIVINHCIKFLKRQVQFSELEHLKLEQPDLSDEWMHALTMEIINAEIQNLPDGCRIVFNLFLLENYTHKEIADMLEISESTSKSQYHRAKQLLRKQLTKRLQHG